jgi:hypothetical protein
MEVLQYEYLKNYTTLPTSYMTNFELYVNDYFVNKYEFGGDGAFGGYDDVIFWGIGEQDLEAADGSPYFGDGSDLFAQIKIWDYVPTLNPDYFFYFQIGTYSFQGTMPSQPGSPIQVSASHNLGAGMLGSI